MLEGKYADLLKKKRLHNWITRWKGSEDEMVLLDFSKKVLTVPD